MIGVWKMNENLNTKEGMRNYLINLGKQEGGAKLSTFAIEANKLMASVITDLFADGTIVETESNDYPIVCFKTK
jgi:hypothetical protein